MSRKEFSTYLEDTTQPLRNQENEVLANILDQVAQLDSPDPGPEYWHQFNARLQKRIEASKAPRSRRWWFYPSWAALAAVLFLGIMFGLQQGTPQNPPLDELSLESLAYIDEVYSAVEEPWTGAEELAGDFENLFETIELLYDEDLDDQVLEGLPGDAMLELWEMEG